LRTRFRELACSHAPAGTSGTLLQIEQQLPQLPGRAVPPERGLIVGGFDFPDVEASGALVKETLDLGLVTAEQ
jgi:hypothetical protein